MTNSLLWNTTICLMGKSIVSMVMFHIAMLNYQKVPYFWPEMWWSSRIIKAWNNGQKSVPEMANGGEPGFYPVCSWRQQQVSSQWTLAPADSGKVRNRSKLIWHSICSTVSLMWQESYSVSYSLSYWIVFDIIDQLDLSNMLVHPKE